MIILAGLWILWCVLHSLLISRASHTAAEKILGRYYSFYRLGYVGFSLLSLIPVLWFQFSLPERIIIPAGLLFRTGQGVLLLYACFMFVAGARVYDMGYFLGLAQWRNFRTATTPAEFPFHTNGILAYVRHPWYSGGIALLWGVGSITDVYLLTRIILTCYIFVGTLLEEKRLRMELGSPYTEYCRRVPMLLPWKIFAAKG